MQGIMRDTRMMGRIAWGGAAALLALPLVAMQLTDEVRWTASDFAVFAAMLLAACGAFQLLLARATHRAYLAGAVLAVGTAFLTVWIDLAVGIVGAESDPRNLVFIGVPAVALIGAALARLRPAGMGIAMLATAAAQLVAGALTASAGGPVVPLTLVLTLAWLAAVARFRVAR